MIKTTELRIKRPLISLLRVALVLCALLAITPRAHAQLTLLNQFNTGGGLVGAAYDRTGDTVFVYGSFGSEFQRFTRGGTPISTISRPGEAADDADLEFASRAFMLGSTLVPAGSLLFANGETGTADIYAINRDTGAVIATLTASFGSSHVVGIAFSAARNSIFLLADRLDPITPNTIAEIDPVTGAIINSFGTGADYIINFGDLEVSEATGNLLVVSSFANAIREFTATGTFVRDIALPSGVSGISGIGLDDGRGEAFLSSTSGTVFQVGGFPAVPEPATLSLVVLGLLPFAAALKRRRARV